ncbi:MAG: 50S ribosomal protein L11 methyltransferase, partial [Gemmatimonadota bacterium]|nr:50S ribosomal protein L11 methyltransferase [Gemmatimonadota bacterium]
MAPKRWLVLEARVAAPELRALAAEALLALGGGAVEERGEWLVTYLPAPPALDAFLGEARIRLRDAVPGADYVQLDWRWQEDEDWALRWKQGLEPRKLSARLVVKPSWTDWDAAPGETVIEVDPQMAFGTGEHATTRGCLRLLDGCIRPGDRVLDVGSGSAILSIAAGRLGAREVRAVEYDPDANLNARPNVAANGVADRVRIVEQMADPRLLAELGDFDLVLANILSGIIRPLLPAFRDALRAALDGR